MKNDKHKLMIHAFEPERETGTLARKKRGMDEWRENVEEEKWNLTATGKEFCVARLCLRRE